MVQMTAADQAVVMSLPGNKLCCDCGENFVVNESEGATTTKANIILSTFLFG